MSNSRVYSLLLTTHSLQGVFSVVLLWILSLLMFAGCEFRRVVVNHPIDPQALETLNPGQSSMQDVVQALGAPDDISESPVGMVWGYRYGDAKTMRINFGWIFRIFFPVVPSMNVGRGDAPPQVLHIVMNHDGIFDQYHLQEPLESPQFSFWPF